MADGHGRRARDRRKRHPGSPRVHRPPDRAGDPVPRAHKQLDVHAPRPARPAQAQRPGPARGVDLDLGARDGRVSRRSAPGRLGVRGRRGRADDGAAPERLHDHRPRPRLCRARRDPHVQLRADHAGDPADPRGRALHRDEPRQRRPLARRAAARHRLGRSADQPRHRCPALLRRQAQPADDALGPEHDRRPLRDHGDDRRPHGHRHRVGPGGGPSDRAGAERRHRARGRGAASVPAVADRRLGSRPGRRARP